jgi:arylsulfatase A-like enzyme
LRVPLLVRWPGQLKPGSVNDELVCLTDLAPTVLGLAVSGVSPRTLTFCARSPRGQSLNSEFHLSIPRLIQVSMHCANEFCTYDVDVRDRQLSADWNTGASDTVITRGGP